MNDHMATTKVTKLKNVGYERQNNMSHPCPTCISLSLHFVPHRLYFGSTISTVSDVSDVSDISDVSNAGNLEATSKGKAPIWEANLASTFNNRVRNRCKRTNTSKKYKSLLPLHSDMLSPGPNVFIYKRAAFPRSPLLVLETWGPNLAQKTIAEPLFRYHPQAAPKHPLETPVRNHQKMLKPSSSFYQTRQLQEGRA